MKIYFDMCCLQRPLDDTSHIRVLLEAQAVLAVLAMCESGEIELIASESLAFESSGNPNTVRRDFANRAIAKAAHFVKFNDQLKSFAQSYVAAGVKPLDALHLASAVESNADYFCTCDDRFLKKARSLKIPGTKIVSPLELVAELQQ